MSSHTQYPSASHPPINNYPNTPPPLVDPQYSPFPQQTGTVQTTVYPQYQQPQTYEQPQGFDPNPQIQQIPYQTSTSPPPQQYQQQTQYMAPASPQQPMSTTDPTGYNNIPITPASQGMIQPQPLAAQDLKPLSPTAAVVETRPVAQTAGTTTTVTTVVNDGGQGGRKHARHWTPPTSAQAHWNSGMCDCFDDWKICASNLSRIPEDEDHKRVYSLTLT